MTLSHCIQRLRHRIGYAADDSGFTVLEVVVSVTLLVIVSAAATGAVATSIRTSDATRDRVTATNLAQTDLEIARGVRAPAHPVSATYLKTVGSEKYTVTRTVVARTAGCPVGTLLDVTVLVGLPSGTTAARTDSVIAC